MLELSDQKKDWVWSYSRIKSFEDCPYRWYLRYIACEPEESTFFASYGKFIHELIDKFYKGQLSKDDLEIAYLSGFATNVTGTPPSKKILATYFKDGLEYFKNFKPLPGITLATEEKFFFDVDGVKMQCIIDHIGKDDGLVITDNKSRTLKEPSGRDPPTKTDLVLDDYLKQLYIYAIPVKNEYDEYPAALQFNCFRNQVLIKCGFHIGKLEETKAWLLHEVEKIDRTTDFYPSIEWFKCNFLCEYSGICEYREYSSAYS